MIAIALSAAGAQGGAVLTTVYSFTDPTADDEPNAGLALGSDGSLYGTTRLGGAYGYGAVFKTTTDGIFTTLYSFTGSNDGAGPFAGLVQANDGYFYGTTSGTNNGNGSVFEIDTNGILTTLYTFGLPGDGGSPAAPLAQGADGNFYGTTGSTVFKVSASGALTTLCSLTNGGGFPGALVQGASGDFYGATPFGTLFSVGTNGTLTVLATVSDNGNGPQGSWLTRGSDGYFYGTTSEGKNGPFGSVFKMTATGSLTTLYGLSNRTNDGAFPFAPVVEARDGYFYGTTSGGGASNAGTVFRISADGVLTSLYSFTGAPDGASPVAPLVQASDGSLYGTTQSGGQSNYGTLFRLTILPEFQSETLTNATLTLTWSTEAGGTYQLQYTSDVTSSNWTNLGGAMVATGSSLSGTDFVTNNAQRFYRVVLAP